VTVKAKATFKVTVTAKMATKTTATAKITATSKTTAKATAKTTAIVALLALAYWAWKKLIGWFQFVSSVSK